MKNPKSPSSFLLSIFGLFAVVRGYNIVLITAAQYLTSAYILAPHQPLLSVLLDPQLFALVLATACSTAAGFIINNFYDAEKDRINHPQKFLLECDIFGFCSAVALVGIDAKNVPLASQFA